MQRAGGLLAQRGRLCDLRGLTPAEPHGMIEDGDLRFEAWLDDLRRGWLLACVFGDLIDWTINYAVLASD